MVPSIKHDKRAAVFVVLTESTQIHLRFQQERRCFSLFEETVVAHIHHDASDQRDLIRQIIFEKSEFNECVESSMIKRVLGQPNFSPQTNTTQLSPKLTQTLTTYHPLKLTQIYKLC